MADRPERCAFYWADGDGCELPEGHEGAHQVFGPKCQAISPEGLRCDQVWFHTGAHQVTVTERWADA